MGIFDCFKKTNKSKITNDISRGLAKSAVANLLNEIKKSEKEESVKLTRRPADGDEALHMDFSYHGAIVTAPVYAYFAVRNLATVAGVSFEQMISFIDVLHELVPEVSRTEETAKNGTDDSKEEHETDK